MKRFVTYLYECERGNKTRNVGFIRVNVRNSETSMEVHIRNMSRGCDAGKIYALAHKTDLYGIEVGEITVENGQSDSCFQLLSNDKKDGVFSIDDIEGIGIQLDSGIYIASCWRDRFADKIVGGDFEKDPSNIDNVSIEEREPEREIETEPEMENALVAAEEMRLLDEYEDMKREQGVIYEKIDLSQIRNLPSPNWHLATNSFLLHGFWNYGYLVLKKNVAEDKEILSLGVPGVFEKPEAIMAVFFGFPTFEEIPEEMVKAELNQSMHFSETKKNQETKTGTFGCWFVNLKV